VNKAVIISYKVSNSGEISNYTAGTWIPRLFNTISTNTNDFASLQNINNSSNYNGFKLSAGTYNINVSAPSKNIGLNKIALVYSSTNNPTLSVNPQTLVQFGSIEDSTASTSRSVLSAIVTITSDSFFQVLHCCSNSKSSSSDIFGMLDTMGLNPITPIGSVLSITGNKSDTYLTIVNIIKLL
jgi:hypothetical protein